MKFEVKIKPVISESVDNGPHYPHYIILHAGVAYANGMMRA